MAPLRSLLLFSAAMPLMLGGCSGTDNPTSAALLGNKTTPITTGTLSGDPTSRALQVGATSARASACNFNFDPSKLKANFLAFETAQGANPDQLQKIDRQYEYVRLTVAQSIAKRTDYCSDQTSKTIKADLARHLAGDFTPPPKPVDKTPSLLSNLFEPDSTDGKPFTYESVFDITGKTKNAN